MGRQRIIGTNLVLSSILALFSYLPFELVAKTTLAVCAVLFVTDPFPPQSRLISLVIVVVIGFLAKIEKGWREGQLLFDDVGIRDFDTDGGVESDLDGKGEKQGEGRQQSPKSQ